MEHEDDPEARIRDLERPLSDVARTSELGSDSNAGSHGYVPAHSGAYPPPPPPPPPTVPWDAQYPAMSPMSPMSNTGSSRGFLIPVVIAVFAVLVAGGVSAYLFITGGPSTTGERPHIAGGGGTLSDAPADQPAAGGVGGGKTVLPNPGPTAPNTPPIEQEPAQPSGTTVIVSGIGEDKTIACNETILSISGIENTVTLTGHCTSVSVSGIDNVVTIDSTNSITASGFDNRIVFHTGEPEISTSGTGNTVDRG